MIVSVSVVQEGGARAAGGGEADAEEGEEGEEVVGVLGKEPGHVTDREVNTVVWGGATGEVKVLIIVCVD